MPMPKNPCGKSRKAGTHNVIYLVNPFLHIYSFQHIKKKNSKKKLWKKVKLRILSNFTFFHNVFHAMCILKSFNNHISVFVYSIFEFGTVSKWCITEWVKENFNTLSSIQYFFCKYFQFRQGCFFLVKF